MKNWIKGIGCLVIAAAVAACGQKGGSEYVGSWQSKQYTNITTSIERNGDNFVVKVTEPIMYGKGEVSTSSLPAVYKDGMLEMAGAFGPAKVSYVKSTDTLLMPTTAGTMEYRRVK